MAGGGGLVEPYVRALHDEIESVAWIGAARTVQSVYFGGGTPSLLPPNALKSLLQHCGRAFDIACDAEITLEANPETVTEPRIRSYLEAGVNRISMGVQSLNSAELVGLGRPHTAERAMGAFHTIRRSGCSNINLDLLYGLPGQTVLGWRDTVARALELGPDHMSAYALTPEPGTPIGAAVADGSLALANHDVIDGQERVLQDAIERAGLHRYEVSNYAKPDHECRHNLLYWRCEDWIGVGASAHSHVSGHRWWNRFGPEEYIRSAGSGAVVAGHEALTRDERINEALAFGLRTVEGVSRARFKARFDADPWTAKTSALAHLVDQGLLVQDDGIIRPTTIGLAFADFVAVTLF
jgi:oxygen-independent coproporphyrinogen-3 oxidase